MSNENLPIISAKTEEEFKKIKGIIEPLINKDYTPISKAEIWCGHVTCEIQNFDAGIMAISLPKTVSSIDHSDKYITYYCAGELYMFKLKKSERNDKQIINYKFI